MPCEWPSKNPLMIQYHDEEWGLPVHDDQLLFEHLSLDIFQAGLSWQTILNKRENFRKAFDGFDFRKIANYGEHDIKRLLSNAGIIRNRMKIEATIHNARKVIEIIEDEESFDRFIWQFTKHTSLQNTFRSIQEIPAKTEVSDAMSIALKKKGFKFLGSTICYAFMQAVGMVNDHVVDCFRYKEVQQQ